jgi:hypothetical protein
MLAACLVLATPLHGEEQPPPMQPRSPEDHGPMWIATNKAKCGPYQVVLWTGMATDDKPAPAPYWRIYHENLSPKAKALLAKRFKEVNGELYLDGKKCTVDTPASAAKAAIPAEYECGGYRSVPPEAVERDPVVKTSVSMPSFGVTHTTLTGEVYQREDQYRDIRIWSDRKGDYWSGVSISGPGNPKMEKARDDERKGHAAELTSC